MDTGKLTLFLLGIVILMLAFVAFSVLGFKPCTNECGGSSITGQTGGTAYYAPNETGRTIQTSGGSVLDASRALGRPSTYIDTGGATRDLNCYQMEYCVETPECEEQCVNEGSQCGYGQTPLTNLAASAPFYGDCCDGTACRDGYCRRDECVPDGKLCQYGPTGERDALPYVPGTYTQATNIGTGGTNADGTANPNPGLTNGISIYQPTYYGECCDNSQCIEGYCTPPERECIQQGATCGYGQTPITALVPSTSNYYGQCCDQMACVDGTCQPPEEQCNDRGQFCGYGPQTFTTNYQTPTYYGDCCGDDQCLNGYCSPPAQNCVQTGATCGYGTTYTTVAAPPSANYYGTCCEGDYCSMGRCVPNQGCSGQGETCVAGQISCCEGYECTNGRCVTPCEQIGGTCAYDSDCCQGSWCNDGTCSNACMEKEGSTCLAGRRECCAGMECSSGRCTTPCTKSGPCGSDGDCCDDYYCSENNVCTERVAEGCQTSGSCAVGAAVCCEGYYCNDNLVCTPMESGDCTDSDGMDYFVSGYATGEYQGDYGTYYDYCEDTYHVVEYYCAATAAVVTSTTYTCGVCDDGACVQ